MITKTELDKYSYSRLNTFIQCPMKYDLKYNKGNYTEESQLHLELGNILHKALEIKYRDKINKRTVDHSYIKSFIENGISEETDKDNGRFLKGVKQIKETYGESTFSEVSKKSGLTYEEKMGTFYDYLEEDTIDDWMPIHVELPFTFSFEKRVIIEGYIDRIDQNSKGELRVVDYKSSDKVFEQKDLTTPLQMVIYALACEALFGKIPVEYMYDLILLGEKQQAGTKGFIERGIKKIHKVLDEIEWCKALNEWKPKATPLCWWCEFSGHNESNPWYTGGLCDYYLLWSPDNKTFEKNNEYK
ncbi:RecB family exonuclease [Brevibacillus sp. NRS-1366]|uniref:RecB family exonuclease n=1 Tax=Brevibacillus sp. NRS-1366 TaxID=3233899 RepID=UPI003D25137B